VLLTTNRQCISPVAFILVNNAFHCRKSNNTWFNSKALQRGALATGSLQCLS